jgi:cytochrome c biogenesis protein
MAEKIWKSLNSTRLAISLLIILTVVSVVGIIIPQDLPSFQYLHKLGGFWGKIVLGAQFDHVFSAPWFYALLGLLSLNLVACILTRLWKNLIRSFKVSFLGSEAEIEGFKHQYSFITGKSVPAAREGAVKSLRKLGFSTHLDEKSSQVSGKKGGLKEVGSIAFHSSIILLFIGGLLGKFGGYSVLQEFENGQVAPVPQRTFLVRSDWFKIETNEKGEIKEYMTKLSVLKPDSSLILEKVVEVNSPLTYQGVRFYQASYNKESEAVQDVSLLIKGIGKDTFSYEGTFPFNQAAPIPGTKTLLTVKRFLGDFVLEGEHNVPGLRSKEHNNPAILVGMADNNDKPIDQWIFQNFPDVHEAKGKYKVVLLEYTPILSTGIQIRYSPGIQLIWTGILLMTLGILAMFYVSKRSLWVFIKEQDGKTSVSIGGISDRAPSSFRKAFEAACASVKNTIEGGSC